MHGNPVEDMPVTQSRLELTTSGTGTRMTLTSRYASLEQFQQSIEMGMEEGIRLSVGQMDALLVS